MRPTPEDWRKALRERYGPVAPPASPIAALVEAVISPGASRARLDEALKTLETFGLLDAAKLDALDEGTVAEAIRAVPAAPAKARKLKAVLAWYVGAPAGDPGRLREQLLELKGIGPATADAVLLGAFGVPAIPVDPAAWRVLTRHAAAPESADYDELAASLRRGLPREAEAFREFRAHLARVGREHCRAKAKCAGCPLDAFPHA